MNIHISKEIQEKWPQFEFRGHLHKSGKFGYKYMEAHHKILNQTFFYVMGADSFVCKDSIVHGAPELIFEDET